MRYLNRACLMCACIFAVSACSNSSPFFPGAHKVEIRQGNVITEQMISQLKVGMTKRQVRFILGTPLLVDTFSVERWDYFFSLDERKGEIAQKKLSVFFEDEQLSSFTTSP